MRFLKLLLLSLILYTIYSIQNTPPALAASGGTYECWFREITNECRLLDHCENDFVPPSGACDTTDQFICNEQLGGECLPEGGPLPSPTPIPAPNLTPGSYQPCCGNNKTYSPFFCGGLDTPKPCKDTSTLFCHKNLCASNETCESVSGIYVCVLTTNPTPPPYAYDPCSGIPDDDEHKAQLDACRACTTDNPPKDGVPDGTYTAIGCIPTEPQAFVSVFIKWAISVGGGIAFLLIIYGAFTVITAAGEPEKLKAGQETITSAITGILFIIFAIFLLRFIGADLLKIPGFG